MVILNAVTSTLLRLSRYMFPVGGIGVISESLVGSEDIFSTGEESDLQDFVVIDASQKDPVPFGSPRSLRHVKRRFVLL